MEWCSTLQGCCSNEWHAAALKSALQVLKSARIAAALKSAIQVSKMAMTAAALKSAI
jgi:hypothetical protein